MPAALVWVDAHSMVKQSLEHAALFSATWLLEENEAARAISLERSRRRAAEYEAADARGEGFVDWSKVENPPDKEESENEEDEDEDEDEESFFSPQKREMLLGDDGPLVNQSKLEGNDEDEDERRKKELLFAPASGASALASITTAPVPQTANGRSISLSALGATRSEAEAEVEA